MQLIIQKRLDLELIAGGKMKMINQDNMGKPVKVCKPLRIGRININGAGTPFAPAGCMGMPASSLNGEWMVPMGWYFISFIAVSFDRGR